MSKIVINEDSLTGIESCVKREQTHAEGDIKKADDVYGRCACSQCIHDRHAIALHAPALCAALRAERDEVARLRAALDDVLDQSARCSTCAVAATDAARLLVADTAESGKGGEL